MIRWRSAKLKWTCFGIATSILVFDTLVLGPEKMSELVATYDRGAFPRRMISEKFTRPLESTTMISVQVKNVAVDVVVDEKSDSIEARLEGELPSIEGASNLAMGTWGSASRIWVREEPKSFWVRHFSRGTSNPSKLTIVLPKRFSGDLTVRSDSGATSLTKVSLSKFDFESRSGGLDGTGSDVHVMRVATDTGSVSFDGRSQDVSIESKAGHVRTTLRDAPETGRSNVRVRTHSGDVSILVDAGASLAVVLESLSGTVASNLVFDEKAEKSEKKIVGAVNEGHGTLDVKTWSGKITADGSAEF